MAVAPAATAAAPASIKSKATTTVSLEAAFHKRIKVRFSKKDQGYIMGAFREALHEHDDLSRAITPNVPGAA